MKISINKIIKATDSIRELVVYYLLAILVCASLFSLFEHKAFFDSLWWAFVTAMTIGYGDIFPITVGGKVIAVILMHIVPLLLIPLITARMASKLIVNNDAFTNKEQEEIKQSLRKLIKWHEDSKDDTVIESVQRRYPDLIVGTDLVFTVKEFYKNLGDGTLNSADGYPYWVKDGKKSYDYVFTTEQEDATHVIWYKKEDKEI